MQQPVQNAFDRHEHLHTQTLGMIERVENFIQLKKPDEMTSLEKMVMEHLRQLRLQLDGTNVNQGEDARGNTPLHNVAIAFVDLFQGARPINILGQAEDD